MQIITNVSFQEKMIFTKHLDTMIRAGIPIASAIRVIYDQTKNKYFKKIIGSVLKSIENGQSLAGALSKHKNIFDGFYISVIKVSEASGTLEENLEFLASQLKKDYVLRKKVKSALAYPLIVVVATLIMGTFISIFVLPKLIDFFESFELELPLTTKILLWFSYFVKDYGILTVLVLTGLGIVFFLLLRLNGFKFLVHKIILKSPVIGTLLINNQLARFSRNLGVLIKSGVPVVAGLEITADTLTNLVYRRDLKVISSDLSKGQSIGVSMVKRKFTEFPPLVSKMIAIGERTGNLDESLLYLSDFYEEEIDDLSKNLSTIIEPILLIGIGLVVGFIALSIISPIYQLTGSIGRR